LRQTPELFSLFTRGNASKAIADFHNFLSFNLRRISLILLVFLLADKFHLFAVFSLAILDFWLKLLATRYDEKSQKCEQK
jgi:hypothetical protein